MTEQEDFIVHDPYQPKEEESLAISELKAKGLVPNDWDSGKNGIKSFKENLREHMYYEQNCRCAYCRIEIPIACCFLQREHIISKTLHPIWMFEPRNLCIACDKCNNYKLDEEVLANPKTVDYPTESRDFLIINPFLDKYSEHIELKDGIIYVGKTKKGRFTIETCHLYRTDLVLERAKMRMENENSNTVLTQILLLLSKMQISDNERNKVLIKFGNIVKMYKNNRVMT